MCESAIQNFSNQSFSFKIRLQKQTHAVSKAGNSINLFSINNCLLTDYISAYHWWLSVEY